MMDFLFCVNVSNRVLNLTMNPLTLRMFKVIKPFDNW